MDRAEQQIQCTALDSDSGSVKDALHDGGVRHAIGLSEPLRGIKDLLLHHLDVLKALLQLLADDEPARCTGLSGTHDHTLDRFWVSVWAQVSIMTHASIFFGTASGSGMPWISVRQDLKPATAVRSRMRISQRFGASG